MLGVSVSKRSDQIATFLCLGEAHCVQGTLHSLQHTTEKCQGLAKLHGFGTFRKYRREERNQIGKHTTFAGAWFHKPSLSGNLQGTLTTVSSAPSRASVWGGPGCSGWAGLGAWGCGSPLEKQLALQSASVLLFSASKLLRAELQCYSIAASPHFHRSPLWPLFQGSSWSSQPIRGPAAAGLKGAAAFAAAAAPRGLA